MITFFATRDCLACQTIRETLEEMTLAHKVVVKDGPGDEGMREDTDTPVLVDDHDTVRGHQGILTHLERLGRFKAAWERFQSDACYCDEEGDIE